MDGSSQNALCQGSEAHSQQREAFWRLQVIVTTPASRMLFLLTPPVPPDFDSSCETHVSVSPSTMVCALWCSAYKAPRAQYRALTSI